jgi:hypothetical protein
MPIEPISVAPPLGGPQRARRRQAGFAMPDPEGDLPAESPAEASGAAPLPLLTLQAADMADAPSVADREAARQGDGVLAAMRGLQIAMLGGGGGLAALANLAKTLPDSTDPVLNAVLRAIAQRAAVERARWG